MAGESDEIQTGYFTNTNLEYSVYVIFIPVLNEIREESRTNTKWPKLCEAKCMCVCVCVVSPSVEISTGNC